MTDVKRNNLTIRAAMNEATDCVLSDEACHFLVDLHRNFEAKRQKLLAERLRKQRELDNGTSLEALMASDLEDSKWKVAEAPHDLVDRRVEITGPTDRKMMINALNSGAKVFMADLEDSLSPTWENVIDGQRNLFDAVRRNLDFTTPEGKDYRLSKDPATLTVRPRGWHLWEKHCVIDGQPMSASLFDLGLHFFHSAHELLRRKSGPYFYLPKLESAEEAGLWNDVFCYVQDALGIPRGTVRATVLIETIPGALVMDQILFRLKDHAAGLNAGRWDYIFSIIKKLGRRPSFILPDRTAVTMDVPFMRAYSDLLVHICHKRGAHAIGGMAAFVPSRRNEEVNRMALLKVREDKEREVNAGFDGTWVAHPDLVPVAADVFNAKLKNEPHQKHVLRQDVQEDTSPLLRTKIEGQDVTEAGVRNNISIGIQYLYHWIQGLGCVALNNLMEDAATAEISRAQIWQWLHHQVPLHDGRRLTLDLYKNLKREVLEGIEAHNPEALSQASELFDRVSTGKEFVDFLTVPAYEQLK